MTMRRTNDFVVGLVIILGAAVIVGATLWARQADVGRRRAEVTARFRDVSGIQVGNAVLIRGVRAGRVRQVELADDGWVQVRLTLDPAVQLPPDPAVILSASSLFGEWQATVVSRSAAPQNPEVLQQIVEASGERGVLPGATLPDVAQLTGVAGRIAGDVASVAERFDVAFNDSAAHELRRSIANVELLTSELAGAVAEQSGNVSELVADVRRGVRTMNAAAAGLQRTVARIDSSTSEGQIAQAVADAAEAAARLRETAVEVRALAFRLSATQQQVDVTLARADSVMAKVNAGQGSLGQLVVNPSLYRNSDSLMIELRQLVADIRAHPKRYVRMSVF
jgi:phospholipid/cholesterol/gamma-HCH transport system substrate-binding protein